MGYNDYDLPGSDGLRDPNSMIQTLISVIVRIVGMIILFVGLWVGLKVILEAWALYESPARIERFAVAIENGSNLDKIFSATVERMSSQVMAETPADEPRLSSEGTAQPEAPPVPALRLSYFAAWFIVMMLMLIVGSLAMSAISAGGKLALYDTEVKKYSREVVREFARLKRAT